ncbi:MAG: pilus assembly protein PilM [Patescibacteria group bacterium]
MLFFGKKRSIALGIDINSYSIEVLAISDNRDIVAYERVPVREGVIRNGAIQKPDVLKITLDQALAKIHARTGALSGMSVIANIPDQQTYTHYIDVPVHVTGADLTEYVRKEAETIVPLEAGDMTATYITLEAPQRHQASKQVLFMGVRKDVTRTIMEVLRAVELRHIMLDAESLALMRSLLPKDSKDTVMILDGGSETSAMHIFEGRSLPMVSVAYPEGGVQATRRIADTLNLSFEEAEKMKCAFGLLKAPHPVSESEPAPSSHEEGTGQQENTADVVSSVLHAWYQLMLSDVEKAIGFYETQHQKRVSRIILSGGAALLPGVAQYLTAWLGRPVRVGNPLVSIRNAELLGKEKPSIVYATVIGLALRGVEGGVIGADFEHGTITETKQRFFNKRRAGVSTGIIIGITIIIIILVIYGIFNFFGAEEALRYEKQ